jgi:hypothetical protein
MLYEPLWGIVTSFDPFRGKVPVQSGGIGVGLVLHFVANLVVHENITLEFFAGLALLVLKLI